MISTCDAYDAYRNLRDEQDGRDAAQAVAAPWRSLGGRARFTGTAATVRCFNDNTVVRRVLGEPGEGRVLVVDGAGSTSHALMGDVVGRLAQTNGWAGVVVHGAVRDSAALAGLDLGVMALGTVPRPSRKEGAGIRDVAVVIAGAHVRPGDLVLADEDGVVVIAAAADHTPLDPA